MNETLSLLILSVCASVSAVLIFQQADRSSGNSQNHLKMQSLAICFIALAPLAQLLLGGNINSDTLQRMLVNLSNYAGLPMLSSTLFALAFNKDWSRAAWGRWLLALFACFELFRRSGVGEVYSIVLFSLTAAAWLLAAIVLVKNNQSKLHFAAALLGASSLILLSPFNLLQAPVSPMYSIGLALAFTCLAFAGKVPQR